MKLALITLHIPNSRKIFVNLLIVIFSDISLNNSKVKVSSVNILSLG